MVMSNRTKNGILTGFLLAIVGLSYLTDDNMWVVMPVAFAAIIFSFSVGFAELNKDDANG